jgi:hypothetical protein
MGLAGEMWPYFRPNYNKCKEYVEKLDKEYDKVVAFLPTGAFIFNRKLRFKCITLLSHILCCKVGQVPPNGIRKMPLARNRFHWKRMEKPWMLKSDLLVIQNILPLLNYKILCSIYDPEK